MSWWVTERGQDPIGPVSTELLLKGIAAGKVGREVLVCGVGETQWRPILEIDIFAEALAPHALAGRPAHGAFDDPTEHTTVDRAPESPDRGTGSFDDPAEQTVVDVPRLESSEPPPERDG